MIGTIRYRVQQLRTNLRLTRTLRLIWSISKKWTTLTLVSIVAESGLYLLLLYIFKHLINEVTKATPFDDEKVRRVVWYLVIITAGTIVYVTVKALATLAIENQAQRVKESIDEKIHECAVNLDLAFFESPAYFDTMKRAKDAGPEAPNNVVLNLADITKNGLTLLAIGSILISISWLLVPLLLLFVAPTLAVRIRYADQMYQWRRRQTPVERQATYLSSLITEDVPAKEIRGFTVLSEVGSKDSSVEYTADEWTQWLRDELTAGAWKVITEAREGGTAGIFDSSGGMRTELIGEIADAVGTENVVFEAPSKAAQAWFVKKFGPSVNLGNIPPEEVIPLETLRLGLRGDTLKEVLLAARA